MTFDEFIKFLHQVKKEEETLTFDHDFDVQIRWHNKYDGVTKWHPLFQERGMFRYGYFPHQADYRIRRQH